MKHWLVSLLFLLNAVHSSEPPLSEKLRQCAIGLHEPDLGREVDVEAFKNWSFSQEEYVGYLTDLSVVHLALEETIDNLSEEFLKPLKICNTRRQQALELDMNYFGQQESLSNEAAVGYAAYLRSLKDAPHRLVAHFYVLYFSMLSGGMKIAEKASEQFLLPPQALNAYQFSAENHEVKVQLRQSFDQLVLSAAQEKEVLDEVATAFIRLTALLKRLDHSSYSLFVGIWLPEELSEILISLSTPDLPRTVWHPPNTHHINLRYIKRIDFTQPGSLHSVLAAYRAMNDIRFAPLTLSLSDLYTISENHEKKWRGWICMHVKDSDELIELRRQIDNALTIGGIEQEKKPFQPHVTLAHVKGAPLQLVEDYIQNKQEVVIAPFTVRSIDLMLSCHKRVRAIYQIESDWHFGAQRIKSDPDLLVRRVFAVGLEDK